MCMGSYQSPLDKDIKIIHSDFNIKDRIFHGLLIRPVKPDIICNFAFYLLIQNPVPAFVVERDENQAEQLIPHLLAGLLDGPSLSD